MYTPQTSEKQKLQGMIDWHQLHVFIYKVKGGRYGTPPLFWTGICFGLLFFSKSYLKKAFPCNHLLYCCSLVHGPPSPELPAGLPWQEEKVHLGGWPWPHSRPIADLWHTKDLAYLRNEDEHVLPDNLFLINNQGEIFYPKAAFKVLLKYVSIMDIIESNNICIIYVVANGHTFF